MNVGIAVAQIEACPGRLSEAVAAHVRMAEAAVERGAKLLIFPELSLTGYSHALTHEDAIDVDASSLHSLVDISRRRGLTIVAGAPLASSEGLQIASFCFLPEGRIATYTKQHL